MCGNCDGTGSVIRNPCTSCRGKGVVHQSVKETINIPKGVDNGVNLRVSKKPCICENSRGTTKSIKYFSDNSDLIFHGKTFKDITGNPGEDKDGLQRSFVVNQRPGKATASVFLDTNIMRNNIIITTIWIGYHAK